MNLILFLFLFLISAWAQYSNDQCILATQINQKLKIIESQIDGFLTDYIPTLYNIVDDANTFLQAKCSQDQTLKSKILMQKRSSRAAKLRGLPDVSSILAALNNLKYGNPWLDNYVRQFHDMIAQISQNPDTYTCVQANNLVHVQKDFKDFVVGYKDQINNKSSQLDVIEQNCKKFQASSSFLSFRKSKLETKIELSPVLSNIINQFLSQLTSSQVKTQPATTQTVSTAPIAQAPPKQQATKVFQSTSENKTPVLETESPVENLEFLEGKCLTQTGLKSTNSKEALLYRLTIGNNVYNPWPTTESHQPKAPIHNYEYNFMEASYLNGFNLEIVGLNLDLEGLPLNLEALNMILMSAQSVIQSTSQTQNQYNSYQDYHPEAMFVLETAYVPVEIIEYVHEAIGYPNNPIENEAFNPNFEAFLNEETPEPLNLVSHSLAESQILTSKGPATTVANDDHPESKVFSEINPIPTSKPEQDLSPEKTETIVKYITVENNNEENLEKNASSNPHEETIVHKVSPLVDSETNMMNNIHQVETLKANLPEKIDSNIVQVESKPLESRSTIDIVETKTRQVEVSTNSVQHEIESKIHSSEENINLTSLTNTETNNSLTSNNTLTEHIESKEPVENSIHNHIESNLKQDIPISSRNIEAKFYGSESENSGNSNKIHTSALSSHTETTENQEPAKQANYESKEINLLKTSEAENKDEKVFENEQISENQISKIDSQNPNNFEASPIENNEYENENPAETETIESPESKIFTETENIEQGEIENPIESVLESLPLLTPTIQSPISSIEVESPSSLPNLVTSP